MQLNLRQFKCFEQVQLGLAPLTLLTGLNGSGKSTIIQSLLLLAENLRPVFRTGATASSFLALNSPLANLGEVRDVVNRINGGSIIEIGIGRERSLSWVLGHENLPRERLAMPVRQVTLDGSIISQAERLEDGTPLIPASLREGSAEHEMLRTLARLRYVPADRFGPSETYPLDDPKWHETLGPRAERSFGNLFWLRFEPIPIQALRHPDHRRPGEFLNQVEAWLGDFFPGVVLEPSKVLKANLMTLAIRTSDQQDFYRTQNVGFGISYCLPIVIATLSALPGDIIVIDSPEAHLHPRAQARVGYFCARAAHAGLQIILETHSDHVLNGVRLAAHQKAIGADELLIWYFSEPEPGHVQPRITKITSDSHGRLDHWPPGFFDEATNLLEQLLE